MAISRETIYAALATRMQAKVTLCKTFARKWVEAQQAGADQQPMLLCLEGDESPRDEPPLPPIWLLSVDVVVYARTNDSATPGTVLSNILDQIESALEPQPTEGSRRRARTRTSGSPACSGCGSPGPSRRKTGPRPAGKRGCSSRSASWSRSESVARCP
jgi:hypothetical protein